MMDPQRRKDLKEYGESLCMIAHGGEVPGRAILELLLEVDALLEVIADLRMPPIAMNVERE